MLERFLLSYYFKLAKVPVFAWDIVKPVKLGDKSLQCPWPIFGCGGGRVVSVLVFYSDNPSSNPADY